MNNIGKFIMSSDSFESYKSCVKQITHVWFSLSTHTFSFEPKIEFDDVWQNMIALWDINQCVCARWFINICLYANFKLGGMLSNSRFETHSKVCALWAVDELCIRAVIYKWNYTSIIRSWRKQNQTWREALNNSYQA